MRISMLWTGASAAMGTGILVELAFRLLDAGASAQEIAKAMETEKEKIVVVALVDTLEYLKRGRRPFQRQPRLPEGY